MQIGYGLLVMEEVMVRLILLPMYIMQNLHPLTIFHWQVADLQEKVPFHPSKYQKLATESAAL